MERAFIWCYKYLFELFSLLGKLNVEWRGINNISGKHSIGSKQYKINTEWTHFIAWCVAMFIYICIQSLLLESHYYQHFELLIMLLLSIKVSTWFEFLYMQFLKQGIDCWNWNCMWFKSDFWNYIIDYSGPTDGFKGFITCDLKSWW
jgi:hypothetical protein